MMPRKYTDTTLKRLFGRSHNACAFSDCSSPIIESSTIVSGEICHIKGFAPGSPRYDQSLTEAQRNSYDNLILLCGRHHKIVDSDVVTYSPESLIEMRKAHEARFADGAVELVKLKAFVSAFRQEPPIVQIMSNSPGSIQAQALHIGRLGSASIKLAPPPDSIAASAAHRAYILYLVSRYNEFASKQTDRKFRPAAIYGIIRQTFGTAWDKICIDRFVAVASFLQKKIDATIVGKKNIRLGHPNFDGYTAFQHRGL